MAKIVGLHYNVQCRYAGWTPICKVDLILDTSLTSFPFSKADNMRPGSQNPS